MVLEPEDPSASIGYPLQLKLEPVSIEFMTRGELEFKYVPHPGIASRSWRRGGRRQRLGRPERVVAALAARCASARPRACGAQLLVRRVLNAERVATDARRAGAGSAANAAPATSSSTKPPS
eukprot:scaffold2236_cov385-Prasinococcus_capsulatus_cf.AAC.11